MIPDYLAPDPPPIRRISEKEAHKTMLAAIDLIQDYIQEACDRIQSIRDGAREARVSGAKTQTCQQSESDMKTRLKHLKDAKRQLAEIDSEISNSVGEDNAVFGELYYKVNDVELSIIEYLKHHPEFFEFQYIDNFYPLLKLFKMYFAA